MSNKSYRDDPDVDDILSQIMRPSGSLRVEPPTAHKEPEPAKKSPSMSLPKRRMSIMDTPAAPATAMPKKRRKKRSVAKFFKILLIILLIGAIGGMGGFALYKGPVSKLLYGTSPFSKQLKDSNYYFTLYYPSRLPEGLKIDKSTIASPTGGVIVYAVTGGKSNITVSLQALPDGLKLDELYKKYSDLSELATPIGKATVGVLDGKTIIANIVTEKTWVIINTDVDTISRSDFETILKNLKQG